MGDSSRGIGEPIPQSPLTALRYEGKREQGRHEKQDGLRLGHLGEHRVGEDGRVRDDAADRAEKIEELHAVLTRL